MSESYERKNRLAIREDKARGIYIVASGEMMALYAANNIAIAKGIEKFTRTGGWVASSATAGMSRGETELVRAFAEKSGTRIIPVIPWDPVVQQAEIRRRTVEEYAPGLCPGPGLCNAGGRHRGQ